ncbi:MAG: Rieske 2Fe-2S domain-containing protein [Candidatus Latescibacteria bacterium]|nr:Rieske 2Fe-2S domain-containing protein [Candidatus Latescibacterota bacterium]
MADNKLVALNRSPAPLTEEPSSSARTRGSALILFGSLAAAALAAGCEGQTDGNPAAISLPATTEGSCPLDLSAVQYAVLQQVGGAVMVVVDGRRLIIARTAADTYTAYTATCTHEGCSLPLPSTSGVISPGHGACFDLNGQVLRGPARRNLAQVVLRLDGEILNITP